MAIWVVWYVQRMEAGGLEKAPFTCWASGCTQEGPSGCSNPQTPPHTPVPRWGTSSKQPEAGGGGSGLSNRSTG